MEVSVIDEQEEIVVVRSGRVRTERYTLIDTTEGKRGKGREGKEERGITLFNLLSPRITDALTFGFRLCLLINSELFKSVPEFFHHYH